MMVHSGNTTARMIYNNRPMPILMSDPKTHRARMMVGSIPKDTPKPPHTPANFLSWSDK